MREQHVYAFQISGHEQEIQKRNKYNLYLSTHEMSPTNIHYLSLEWISGRIYLLLDSSLDYQSFFETDQKLPSTSAKNLYYHLDHSSRVLRKEKHNVLQDPYHKTWIFLHVFLHNPGWASEKSLCFLLALQYQQNKQVYNTNSRDYWLFEFFHYPQTYKMFPMLQVHQHLHQT